MRKIAKLLICCMLATALVGCVNTSAENKEIAVEYKTLMEGTEKETKVYVIDSGKEGPTIFINGGTHGDEIAGYMSAEKLMSQSIDKGRLIILPRANNQACRSNTRKARDLVDLNRQFPGDKNGQETQRLAYEISQLIVAEKPAMVLDLHESLANYRDGRLGNSIIFTEIEDTATFVLDILMVVNERVKEGEDFTFISNAPAGSMNVEISNNYKIPVLTIETNRQIELEDRIEEHLIIVEEVLKKHGLIEEK